MMRALLAFVAICLSAVMLRAEPSLPILPADELAAWPAVGRFNTAGFSTTRFCTGTLIAPDVVLTAGHCAPRGAIPEGERNVFVAGWLRDENAGYREVIGGLRHPAYGIRTRHDPRFDLGLAFLASPFDDVAPLPLAPFPEGPREFALLGYNKQRPFALSGRFDCQLTELAPQALRLDCPVVSGNSGSPILYRAGNGWQVVAVTSSKGQPGSIATRVNDWVLDTVAAHTSP